MWTEFTFFWFFFSLLLWGLSLHAGLVELVFLAMGSTLTFALSFLIPSDRILFLWIEIFIFLLSSFLIFFFFYSRIKSFLHKETLPNLQNRLKGERGVCSQKISRHNDGSVLCEGTYWKARSTQTIQQDEAIEVIEQEGLVLIVQKIR